MRKCFTNLDYLITEESYILLDHEHNDQTSTMPNQLFNHNKLHIHRTNPNPAHYYMYISTNSEEEDRI